MSTLFAGKVGAVARIDDPIAQCVGYIGLHGDAVVDFASHSAFVTRITGGHGVSYQLLQTFSDAVFVYTFGKLLSRLNVSGLAVCGCDDGAHGLVNMFAWWQGFNAADNPKPITLMIGRQPIEAILVEFSHDVADLAFDLASWSATLQGVVLL